MRRSPLGRPWPDVGLVLLGLDRTAHGAEARRPVEAHHRDLRDLLASDGPDLPLLPLRLEPGAVRPDTLAHAELVDLTQDGGWVALDELLRRRGRPRPQP